jgi:hypothetical protein
MKIVHTLQSRLVSGDVNGPWSDIYYRQKVAEFFYVGRSVWRGDRYAVYNSAGPRQRSNFFGPSPAVIQFISRYTCTTTERTPQKKQPLTSLLIRLRGFCLMQLYFNSFLLFYSNYPLHIPVVRPFSGENIYIRNVVVRPKHFFKFFLFLANLQSTLQIEQ